MDAKQSLPADPVELVRQLDSEAIRQRLHLLDQERAALLVLLRAALRARSVIPSSTRETDNA